MTSELPPPPAELSDQQILELTAKLKAEEAEKRPLVGPNEPLSSLQDEYCNALIFTRKIHFLQAQGYQHIRRLRGDGDCFYRAVAFAFASSAIRQGATDQASARLQSLDAEVGTFFDREIVQDFAEPLQQLLKERPAEEALLARFNDPEVSNSTVVYLRLLSSAHIRKNGDEFFPFLFSYEDDARILDPETGMPSVVAFCQHYIEAMSRDADHLAITGLTQALDLKLKIAYLDQSKGEESGPDGVEGQTSVDFVDFDGSAFSLGDSVLLLRPGHFDILRCAGPFLSTMQSNALSSKSI
jgi:ubiquitin thioesterase protein OTUB1